MNIEQFNKLKAMMGESVVGHNGFEYSFSFGDDLNNMDEETFELSERLERECGDAEGLNWYIAIGDDIPNGVGAKELSDLDKVEGLEDFINEYVGENCYTDEDEDED